MAEIIISSPALNNNLDKQEATKLIDSVAPRVIIISSEVPALIKRRIASLAFSYCDVAC